MQNNSISCVAEHETTVHSLYRGCMYLFVLFQLSTTWLNSTVKGRVTKSKKINKINKKKNSQKMDTSPGLTTPIRRGQKIKKLNFELAN